MRIGIISDTHGSVQAWNDALKGPFKDVDQIWHCGDVLYHGPRNPLPESYNPQELANIMNGCSKPIVAVFGNCDSEVDQMVLDIALQLPFVLLDHSIGRVLMSHGHRYNVEMMEEMAREYQVKIWVSGHTHEPLIKQQDGFILLNPGSPSLPKGANPRRSVALLNSTTIELFDLDLGEAYASMELES